MAVVHQRISQLSSSGLMNIESSHKFNRSGDTASGCIEGVNLEDYQVGVIGGAVTKEVRQKMPSSMLVSNVSSDNYVQSSFHTELGSGQIIGIGKIVFLIKDCLHFRFDCSFCCIGCGRGCGGGCGGGIDSSSLYYIYEEDVHVRLSLIHI